MFGVFEVRYFGVRSKTTMYLYGMLYIFQSNPLFYRGLILAEFEYQLQVVWKCCQKSGFYIIYLVLTLICFPENGPAPALLTQI